MLVTTAIGDAYAAAWEFLVPGKGPSHDWSGYRKHPVIPNALAGYYTDDTLRTLANARVIISGRWQDPSAYVAEIKRVFLEDARGGWSKNFRAFLAGQMGQPDDVWPLAIRKRDTNGALMGAAVMGLVDEKTEAMAGARTQAFVTHTPETEAYAAMIALAAFGVRTGACGPGSVVRYVREEFLVSGSAIRKAASGPVGMGAGETCLAALGILDRHTSLSGMMGETIARGGDTDSVAAITFGVAGMAPGTYKWDLPAWTVTEIDRLDPAGIERLVEAESLLANAGLPVPDPFLVRFMEMERRAG